MFTGLIELLATITTIRQTSGGAKLAVDLGAYAGELQMGDSVAINGVCLTATSTTGSEATFDMVSETLERSTLVKLQPGDQVNIERALKAGDRLGGHFVQGHVDGIGVVSRIDRSDGFEIEIAAPPDIMELIVTKGSIAVDGVSLTVARKKTDRFAVALIPLTLESTTLGLLKPGNRVNLETDILGKYVRQFVKGTGEEGVTEDLLRKSGFM